MSNVYFWLMRQRKFLNTALLFLITGPGWSAASLIGRWKPISDPSDARTRRILRISLSPSDDRGGVRYAEGGEIIYEAKPDGQLHPALNGRAVAYQLQVASEREIFVTTVKDKRILQSVAMQVAEEGKALLVDITSRDDKGRDVKEGLYYKRIPMSECGSRVIDKPALSVYGCWLWLDGERKLAHQPEPITIEQEDGGYRLESPTQTISLGSGGAASVVSHDGSINKSPTLHWKMVKEAIEITVVTGTGGASGTMSFELVDPNLLSVNVVNSNGIKSSYTYRRQ